MFGITDFIKNGIEIVSSVKDLLSGDKKQKAEAFLKAAEQEHERLMGQQAISLQEAKHSSIFVAGARPCILWVCAISLALFFIPKYLLGAFFYAIECWQAQKVLIYPIDTSGLMELVGALLGLGVFRTWEKGKGVAR